MLLEAAVRLAFSSATGHLREWNSVSRIFQAKPLPRAKIIMRSEVTFPRGLEVIVAELFCGLIAVFISAQKRRRLDRVTTCEVLKRWRKKDKIISYEIENT